MMNNTNTTNDNDTSNDTNNTDDTNHKRTHAITLRKNKRQAWSSSLCDMAYHGAV